MEWTNIPQAKLLEKITALLYKVTTLKAASLPIMVPPPKAWHSKVSRQACSLLSDRKESQRALVDLSTEEKVLRSFIQIADSEERKEQVNTPTHYAGIHVKDEHCRFLLQEKPICSSQVHPTTCKVTGIRSSRGTIACHQKRSNV